MAAVDYMTEEQRIALAKMQHDYTRKITDLVARAVQRIMVENPPPDDSNGTGAAAYIQACLETSYAISLTCRIGPKTFGKLVAGVVAALMSRPPPPGIELIEAENDVVMLRTDGEKINVNEVAGEGSPGNDLFQQWTKL